MDSEVTLVNPSPPTSYFLSSTDLRDTVIFARPSVPLYRITSDTRHIKIWDDSTPTSSSRIIAILHRRDLLSDTLSFPQRGANGSTRMMTNVSIQRWLKRSKMLDGIPAFTFDTEYGQYIWKVISKSQTKVFADYDLEKPVATCYFPRSQSADKPAFILQSDGEPLRDDIVVAYCVQRHRVMMENKALDLLVGSN